MDDATGGAGPRRKTTVSAHELIRYLVDFAARSKIRLSGEASIIERDLKDSYTTLWRSSAESEPREHKVGLTIRNVHMENIVEEPHFHVPRHMNLQATLGKGEYMKIICIYALILVAGEESNNDLDSNIRTTNKNDKILLLGDLNARAKNDQISGKESLTPKGAQVI